MIFQPPIELIDHLYRSAYPNADQRNVINTVFADLGGDGYNEENLQHRTIVLMASSIIAAPRGNEAPTPKAHFGILRHHPSHALVRHHADHSYAIGFSGGLIAKIFDRAFEIFPGEKEPPIGEFWFAFAQVALSLLVEHEYSHITNGHLRLLPNFHSGVGSIFMSHTDPSSSSLEKLDLQTLEMDADAAAVARTVVWAMGTKRFAIDNPSLSPFFAGTDTRDEFLLRVLEACIFAIATVDPQDPDPEHGKAYNHLPRSARIHHAIGTIEGTTRKYFGFSFFENVGREKISETTTKFLEKIGAEPMNQEVLGLYCGTGGHLHELFANWTEKIAPRIDRMSDVVSSDRAIKGG